MTASQNSFMSSNGIHSRVPNMTSVKSPTLKDLLVSSGGHRERQFSLQDGVNPLVTQHLYVKDWSRCRGESLADYAVRLYASNVNTRVPHVENCNHLLRHIIQFVTLRLVHKGSQRLTVRHLVKVESFLAGIMLCNPQKTWQEDIQEMMGLTSKDEGAGELYPQMDKDIKFHIINFIDSIEAMKYGDGDSTDDEMLEETVVNGFLTGYMEYPSLSPLSFSTSNLFLLLHTLASDVLTVHVLPIEVRKRIKQLVMGFRSQCRFWHSPAKAASQFLRPLIKEFVSWLRWDMESLQKASANEAVLYCIDHELRIMLKHQVYESFKQFLSVFYSVKEDGLTNIELPSTALNLLQLAKEVGGLKEPNQFVRTQILKDLNRDRVILNGTRRNVNDAINALKDIVASAQSDGHFDNDGNQEMLYLAKCMWHVLHAASRTVCSGDSFLIVSDLFGGEGISVNTPSHYTPTPICIETEGLTFKVSTAQSYNVYNSDEIDGSPLVALETTTNEMIVFLPWMTDAETEDDTPHFSFDDSLAHFLEGNWGISSDFVSLEDCRRFLSIEVRLFTHPLGFKNAHTPPIPIAGESVVP